MKKTRISGFTLVELIVVVTILAILSTIGFVSYSSYLTGVRDTNRLSQLVSIHDGLELYRTKNDLPLPDDNVEIKVTVSGTDYPVAYQGYAGTNVLETIDFTKGGKDPKDDQYFTYMLTQDRRHFQLMAWLEEELNATTSFFASVHALDYESRIPTVYGKNLGILTNDSQTPIQEIVTSEIIFDGSGTEYLAHIDDTSTTTSNTPAIMQGAYVEIAGKGNKNCKDILAKYPYMQGADGSYWIKIGNENIKLPCDMTTDGGGWTLVLHAHDSDIIKYDTRGSDTWQYSSTKITYIGEESTFKITDNELNKTRDNGSYMSVVSRELDNNTYIYYTPSSCDYNHELGDNGSCGTIYSDPGHVTELTGCTSASDRAGIGCWGTTHGIVTNNMNNRSNAACYNPWAGCTGLGGAATDPMTIKLFVR